MKNKNHPDQVIKSEDEQSAHTNTVMTSLYPENEEKRDENYDPIHENCRLNEQYFREYNSYLAKLV